MRKGEIVLESPRHFAIYFRSIANALTRELDQKSEELGLTSAQGMFLHRIWIGQEKLKVPVYAKDLEDFFDIKHSTVSGILQRLEAAGYLEFCPSPADRRCKSIHLTPKALEAHAQLETHILQINARLVDNMSPEDAEKFRELLQIAAKNMGVCLPCHLSASKQEESKL